MTTIAFRNEAQLVLFKDEIRGQLSDGHWENARPYDHWKSWCRANAIVDPENVGRDFLVMKDNYNLANKELLSWIGDRMISNVLNKTGGYYDAKMLKKDLNDMKVIFKTRRKS